MKSFQLIDDSLRKLVARLPELEWKLSTLFTILSPKQLPRGLFREQIELTPKICMEEIKAELQSLEKTTNQSAAEYLAKNIIQKITVLVRLCQLQQVKAKSEQKPAMTIQSISTRQQWLNELSKKIEELQGQQQALHARLQGSVHFDTQSVLNIKAELGEVGRQLTLAEERLKLHQEIRVR